MAAFVRSTAQITGANVVTAGADFSTRPAVGNHVITCASYWHAATSAGTITTTDNQGGSNSYSTHEQIRGSNVDTSAITSAKVAVSAGTFTVTITPGDTSGNYIQGVASEFTGLASASWFDKGNTAQGTTGVNAATVTATGANAQASELVVATAGFTGSSSNIHVTTATTGYTDRLTVQDDSTIKGIQAADKEVSGVETSAASWAHDSVSVWTACIATFKLVAVLTGNAVPLIMSRRRARS